MTISELITLLEERRKTFGDLEVRVPYDDDCGQIGSIVGFAPPTAKHIYPARDVNGRGPMLMLDVLGIWFRR
jgi:hypothetical protein